EVKRSCADGSVHPHARVGHRQGFLSKTPSRKVGGFSLGGWRLGHACGTRDGAAVAQACLANPPRFIERVDSGSIAPAPRVAGPVAHSLARESASASPASG